MERFLSLAGGVGGAVWTALEYCKKTNRTIDNVVMPIGGFIAGAQIGSIAGDVVAEADVKTKAASAGVKTIALAAGFLTYRAWRANKQHTDAGAVGMGILALVAADVGLGLLDSATTKLLPERKL